ncbi:MAG: Nucleotidyltransferase domain protein [Candidatus Atribacteria bacterium ADurb.Bin276]|uniref:Nucleotidyltransferase domain protein n=1 Tax=Candidatus Atribacter allofermentans TaxID=1852833 RepID=A0A1V5SZG0_9BACT|nr:MAG: Nucleotidyltransferase domain protein [Candidatus Atribacteria bacterium ADurb.Bin276]
MDKKTVISVINRFKKALEKRGIKEIQIILFGSWSKGNYHEESDIDLIVLSDDFFGKSFWERTEILSSAILEVFEPIEAIAMTFQEWEKGDSPIISYAGSGEVIQ